MEYVQWFRSLNSDIVNLPALEKIYTPRIAAKSKKVRAAFCAEFLEAAILEFQDLLDREGHKEEPIHQWLWTQNHHVFLDAYAKQVWSKINFGKKVSDFVVRRSDDTYNLIEIEKATTRIFTKPKSEFYRDFNKACLQVEDWIGYASEFPHELRDVQGLDGIFRPSGTLFIGRDTELRDDEARRRWRNKKAESGIEVFTFDEMCERVRVLAKQLRNFAN